MNEEVYGRLREFMDTMPAGFPATPTGVEIKILKKLFTPDEAEIVMKLRKDPEEISSIASRLGMDESELAKKLEDMAQKGLIFRKRDGDKLLYQAFQFVVGLYEFQLTRLDREFCELFEAYLPYLGLSFMKVKTRQMRVIPVGSSINAVPAVADYNRVRELVKEQETISVAQCICRKEQALLGKECNRPKETCLGFGDFARYYIDNKMARAISVEEALGVLDRAEESALVLSPTNTQDISAICCCCPCCCPILKTSKMMPRPADLVHSYYHARIDPDRCTACGQCIERCQMDAIKEADNGSEIIDGRCIGCGLCVSTCPEEAISLEAKPEMEAPPASFRETLGRIEIERRGLAS
jgi:electron transport complex protein RnfB